MYDITLQHAATRCNTLQHAATHPNMLQHVTTIYTPVLNRERILSRLVYVPLGIVDIRVWHHTATRCNTLQHTTTTQKPVFDRKGVVNRLEFVHLGVCIACVRHHTASHCNTLQHAATRCNTLQHTYLCTTGKELRIDWCFFISAFPLYATDRATCIQVYIYTCRYTYIFKDHARPVH